MLAKYKLSDESTLYIDSRKMRYAVVYGDVDPLFIVDWHNYEDLFDDGTFLQLTRPGNSVSLQYA